MKEVRIYSYSQFRISSNHWILWSLLWWWKYIDFLYFTGTYSPLKRKEAFVAKRLERQKVMLISVLSELLIHLKPESVSGVFCRLHEINQCQGEGHVPSLMLVAMSLGCGSYKGSNGTLRNKHKKKDTSGAWRFMCCCAAF